MAARPGGMRCSLQDKPKKNLVVKTCWFASVTQSGEQRFGVSRKENSASGWPGQVKALDGVPPQSLDSQRSACVLQAFVVVRSPAALGLRTTEITAA